MAKRRRKAKLYVLPGVERRDLLGEFVPEKDVLQRAMDNGISNVVVVGYDRLGELYVASSGTDIDKVCGMVMRAIRLLTQDTARG